MAGCQNKAPKTAAIDRTNFDETVALNDDFYQYATGGWQAKNPLKPEFARYGSFDVLRENNEIRINDLFTEMSKSQSAEGSVERKIADLYNMGLDSTRLNAEGATPIKDEVIAILGISSKQELMDKVAEIHTAAANPFFSFSVDADLTDSNKNVLYLSQDGLSMGTRDYYLDAENAKIKEAYKGYLGKIFTLVGLDETQVAKAVKDVMSVEDAIAKASLSQTELRDIERNYNPMSIKELKEAYPTIDWERYLDKIGVGAVDTLVVGQPSELVAVDRLFKEMPVEALRYYVASQYIIAASPYLSDDFVAATFDFFGRTMSGKQEQKPRWKRAMAVPNNILSEAVGKVYVEKYFPEKDKERMLEMVKNLQTALGNRIASLDWMSDATKAKAQEKLAAFTVKIGYPDTWKDYTTLKIDPKLSYWENIKIASAWDTADRIADLKKPVDKAKWFMSPQTVNAYYNPTSNEICFPAAILQPPFYNPDADDAVNYGAIGVVIGHEMTHGFDDQGRQFDKDGNMNNWWVDADADAFKAKTDVLVAQFNAIEVLPGVFANGAMSLGENIADQGGLKVSYDALQAALKEGKKSPIDGFTPEQRFYLSYAQIWAQNIRDEEAARLTKLDVHSLGKWRVNATLRNIQSFYDAFDIKSGKMFMPEAERVNIW